MPFSVTSLQVVFEDIWYLLIVFHLEDTIARISSRLTIARSCNLCILVRHLPSVCACLYVLIEIVQNIIKQFYITWMHPEYTLRAKHVTFKVYGSIFLHSKNGNVVVTKSMPFSTQRCHCGLVRNVVYDNFQDILIPGSDTVL